MANEPHLQAAKPGTTPAALDPVAVEDTVPDETMGPAQPAVELSTPKADSSRDKLAQLFAHLKVVKIVFVDDKAELETDAGAIIKVVAVKPEASEALGQFFTGVSLNLDNDALQEQLAARLAELDGEKLAELRAVLSAQSEDAAEREALGRLQDILPQETTAHLLTPQAWHERRAALIEECTEERRTLFLFDQELEVDDAGLGFHKGSDIIRAMAEHEPAGFGTRWFCGMLTHTVKKGDEVASWRNLAKSENLDLSFFMPIAKDDLDDAPAFYGAVYRTLINTYSQTMKSLAANAFKEALEEALERFSDLDPIDFEHMIVKSSETEGVSELETLIRVYGIIQKDQVKAQILQHASVSKFSIAARTVKDIADIGRELSVASRERLHKLRREELYESEELVNSYHDPLRNGDLFEIGEGANLKIWVLIAQPCDLMVRMDGKRAYEENFKVAVLAQLRTRELGAKAELTEGQSFSLDHYDQNGAQSALVRFADATPANLHVLDLVVFNKDGSCKLSAEADPAPSLPSKSWEKRDCRLRLHFDKVSRQIEAARKAHKDTVAELLAAALIPRASPKQGFAKGAYDKGAYSYPIRRRGRIRDPLATALLNAYSRFLARDAYEHDYSRAD